MKWPTSTDKWSRFVIGFSAGAKSGDLVKSRYKSFWRTLYELYSFVSRTADSKPAVCFIYFSLSEASWAVWPSLWSLDFQFLNWYNWHSSNNSHLTVQKWRLRWVKAEGAGTRIQEWAYWITFIILSRSLSFILSESMFIPSLACSFFPFNFTENFS